MEYEGFIFGLQNSAGSERIWNKSYDSTNKEEQDIVLYVVRIIIWDQRVIIKERIDHENPTEIR